MAGLRVAAIELPHQFGAPKDQLKLASQLLAEAGPLDLALLPECALTGYLSATGDADLSRFAEPFDGPTAEALGALASRHQVTLAAPLIEAAGGRRYNALAVFGSDGRPVAHYRKRHPWYVEAWATPGDLGTPLFEVAGMTVTIAICFDVHFLEQDAAEQLEQAGLLLFPSAWVDDGPDDARATRLPQLARAFEVAIVNANWGEGTPRMTGQGGSRIIDATGREIRRAPPGGRGSIVTAQLSLPARK